MEKDRKRKIKLAKTITERKKKCTQKEEGLMQ